MSESNNKNIEHHKRYEYCKTRLKYRSGKTLTAVKVYTVAQESKYLLVFGVPKIKLYSETKREFQKYGPVKYVQCVTDDLQQKGAEIELFTDCFKVVFEKLENARRAKKFLDAKNFYRGILHVSYAPEYESMDELRHKLMQRRAEVNYRLRLNNRNENAKRKAQDSIDTSEPKRFLES